MTELRGSLTVADAEKCRREVTRRGRFLPLVRVWERENLEIYWQRQIILGDKRPEVRSLEAFAEAIEAGGFMVFGERVLLLENLIPRRP